MNANLIVVGNGKLADAILEFASAEHLPNMRYPYSVFHWNGNAAAGKVASGPVLVHVGSGRQYHESLEYAERTKGIYIQAATCHDIPLAAPENPSFVFIHAPNLSMLMIKAIYLSKVLGELFKDEKKELFESHQSDKKSVAGTAVKMAGYLGLPQEDIRNIRDRKTQSGQLGITNLERHAFHRLRIFEGENYIELTSKIEGLASYVSGLFRIVGVARTLDAGVYEVEDLIERM